MKSHVNHIFAKTGARDRAQAVVYAYSHGLAAAAARRSSTPRLPRTESLTYCWRRWCVIVRAAACPHATPGASTAG